MNRFTLLAAVLLSVYRCHAAAADQNGTSESVEAVKGGVLRMDKSTTLGQAFDHYRYFTAKVWTPTTTENGRNLLEAAGTINFAALTPKDFASAQAAAFGLPPDLAADPNTLSQSENALRKVQRGFKGAQIVFQFAHNLDDTFELKGGKINVVMADNRVAPIPMSEKEATAALKDIYDGKLPAQILAILLMGGLK